MNSLLLGIGTLFALQAPAPISNPELATFTQKVVPLLTKNCMECHQGERPRGKSRFDQLAQDKNLESKIGIFRKIVERLDLGDMPPEEKIDATTQKRMAIPRPDPKAVAEATTWIKKFLSDQAAKPTLQVSENWIRRLNGAEYDNTIRDLTGIDSHPADDFPLDPVEEGFDNNGRYLTMTSLQFEKYSDAAETISQEVLKDPVARKKVLVCQPKKGFEKECARKILETFLAKALRRPVDPTEVDLILKVYDSGLDFDSGIELALRAVLLSPDFLFRVEIDSAQDANPHAVNPFELASRLSYFLWASQPDDELLDLARKGTLSQPEILEKQVKRMIQDHNPFTEAYRAFDDELRESMFHETYNFFERLLVKGRSVIDFIDSDYTYANAPLARLYGIKDEKFDGLKFKMVKVPKESRGGLLGQASILTTTSHPGNTSPVKRGQWVLTALLCDPPDDPPPGAPPFQRELNLDGGRLSTRKQLEVHRSHPKCQECHSKMDPLGFGLENYNPIGAWRAKDGNKPVDASGELGTHAFNSPKELKALLVERAPQFVRCLTKNMLVYALGRGFEEQDEAVLSKIIEDAKQEHFTLSSLVLGVVKSAPFQMRRSNELENQ
jgi:Protein of unknown function (DUF1588)/Protein of unknown function (DUF1587)/Protein of unknown function (DUF1585)/Protein of unknown function (DUF1595)/Protein of unknown function (DUF1592)